MRLGLLVGELAPASRLARIAAHVEEAGLDSIWAGDHVSFPAPVLDPFEVLTAFASGTSRIAIGTCVYLLPLRHPTVVAKMTSSLDFLSGGRLVFGVGVGGEFPGEFAACGVPVGERGSRTNESLEILRRLWTGERGPWKGRHFEVPPTPLAPRPVQPGGPPVWIGGRSDAALRRTARYGDGYVGYLLDADGFRERMEKIRGMRAEAGREGSVTAALMTFALVGPDRKEALAHVGRVLGAMYARPMEKAAARYCVAGTEEDCREQVARFREAGVEHLILSPLAGGDDLDHQIDVLAALPR